MPRPTTSKLVFQIIRDFVASLAIFAVIFVLATYDAQAKQAQETNQNGQIDTIVENLSNRHINPTSPDFRNKLGSGDEIRLIKAQAFRLPTAGTQFDRAILIGALAIIFASMCTLTAGLWRQIRKHYVKQPRRNSSGGYHEDKGY